MTATVVSTKHINMFNLLNSVKQVLMDNLPHHQPEKLIRMIFIDYKKI